MAGFTITMTPSLKALMVRLQGDITDGLYPALVATVGKVEAKAVKGAPVVTGNLVNSITTDVIRSSLTGIIKATASYAEFVHKGTKPHKIVAHGRALAWPSGGGTAFAKSVMHPGYKGNPWMQKALDDTDVPGEFEDALDNYLNRRDW